LFRFRPAGDLLERALRRKAKDAASDRMRKRIGSDRKPKSTAMGLFYEPLLAQQSATDLNLRAGELTGSSEFTTWVALAGAAILAGLCAIYSSSPWVLIAAALIGAYLGYKGEQLCRAYVEGRLSRNRPR
jgi:hypothetical protein